MQTREFKLDVQVYAQCGDYVLGELVQSSQALPCYVIIDTKHNTLFAQENHYEFIQDVWIGSIDPQGEIE